jgi:Nitrile hydratase beta subunit
MNGIHDMGGMQGMGPIEYENNEPVFHAAWEARVYSMIAAVQATGKLKLGGRPPIESLTAFEYLRMSYYERWLTSLTERMVVSGLVTRAEIESGRPAEGSAKFTPALTAADVPAFMSRVPPMRKDQVAPRGGSHYYEHWLVALERLVTAKGLIDGAALELRKEAWADAYRHTPHGQPVELPAAHLVESNL